MTDVNLTVEFSSETASIRAHFTRSSESHSNRSHPVSRFQIKEKADAFFQETITGMDHHLLFTGILS